MQQLFKVYAADGAYFDKVCLPAAELLVESNAARVEGKSKRITLRLTVGNSEARALLAPRFPGSQKTFYVEYVGEDRSRLYQHNHARCAGYADTLSDLVTA